MTVNVVNGTANGRGVAGDEVIVEIYDDKKPVDTLRQIIGADGKAVFENISLSKHLTAYPRVLHMGMSFSGRAVSLCPDAEQASVRVHAFDISYDKSCLSVTTNHLMIKQKDNLLVVSEFLLLKNSSDMAINSKERDEQDRPVVLKINLPKGFTHFNATSYLEAEALVFDEDGFYDTMTVPPGEHKLVFSYAFDISSKEMSLTKKISIPMSDLIVFSQLEQGTIEGLGESSGQFVMDNGTMAEYYVQGDVAENTEISFKITGLSVGIADKSSWIIAVVAFGVVGLLAAYRVLPTKK